MPITTGTITKKYVSALQLADRRDILGKIIDNVNEDVAFIDIMAMKKAMRKVDVPVYYHHIHEAMYDTAQVTVVTGTGVQITLTIGAGKVSMFKPGDVIRFKDGKTALVLSKTGNDIVVKSVRNVTISATTTIQANDLIAIISNAHGAGSKAPLTQQHPTSTIYNQTQIFKTSWEEDDVQKVSKVEWDVNGKPYYAYFEALKTLQRHKADIGNQMFFGELSDSQFSASSPSLVDADGNPVQTTRGLDQYINDFGYADTMAGASLGLVDIADFVKEMKKRRAPNSYSAWMGTDKKIQWDNLFNNLGNSALLSTSARFMVDGKDLELGIDKVTIYGTTFFSKSLPVLDHPGIANYTGSGNLGATIYFCPEGKTKGVDGSPQDYLSVAYLEQEGGFDPKYKEIMTDPSSTSDHAMKWKVSYYSHMGLDILTPNFFAKLV